MDREDREDEELQKALEAYYAVPAYTERFREGLASFEEEQALANIEARQGQGELVYH